MKGIVTSEHIHNASRFITTLVMNAYREDVRPHEIPNDDQVKNRVDQITSWIPPILKTKLEKFDGYVFPELRAEFMRVMHRTLMQQLMEEAPNAKHAIIEGISRVIDTIPKKHVERYVIRSEEAQSVLSKSSSL